MKLAVLFSGGKDSCLALHKAREGSHEIKYLLTVLPVNFDSFMFHKPYPDLLEKQAEMLGLELVTVKSKGMKEEELGDLKKLIEDVKGEIEGVIVGGIASSYQGERIKEICKELGLEFIAPLWNYKSEEVWNELLNEGFKVILTKISCEGISKRFLGKIIDRKMLEKLKRLGEKYKFRIDFEGGEAESAVLGMPGFKKDIKIDFDIKDEGEYRYYLEMLDVR